jgi:MFS family permease
MPLWRVITALGFTQIIGWGTTYYALGALSLDIAADRGWSKLLIFGAFSAALLISGIISRAAGRAIDDFGGRRLMALGSGFAGLGCLILSFATEPWIYVLGWLVLGPAMRLALYDAAFPALAQVAAERSRRAISYLTLFGGLASTVFWPVSHYLSQEIGWRHTFLVYAALHLLICLPLHLWVLGRGSERQIEADPPPPPASPFPILTGPDRGQAMIAFALVLALNTIVFSSISAHVLPIFEGLGYDAAMAVTLAALIGPAQVASRVGDIMAGHYVKTMTLGLIAVGLLPAALIAFASGGFTLWAALVFALLYGMSNGLMSIIKGIIPLSLFGHQGYGLVIGTLTTPQLFLNAIAPTLFAVVLDQVGPKNGLLVGLFFGLASFAAMMWLARRYPR